MKHPENIKALAALPIDLMGFIFYEKSPRYAGNLAADALISVPASIQKVGVFVDAAEQDIRKIISQYDLQAVQLHGNEPPQLCEALKTQGVSVIKAFPIENSADLAACAAYEKVCDYFLFDTKTPQHGGSGKKFDWQLLSSYTGQTPFFLSGGIGADDAQALKQLHFSNLYALDVNSKFETAPGLKDLPKINAFLTTLQA